LENAFGAPQLVQGDVIKLSLGAVVPADVRLIDGSVLVDQSMLTDESVPIEAGPGFETYAGALIRRGEAIAEIVATGAQTKFGRSAELIRIAHVESSEQKAIFRVVRNLGLFNGGVSRPAASSTKRAGRTDQIASVKITPIKSMSAPGHKMRPRPRRPDMTTSTP
jgi:hypothetical protein